VDVVAFKQHADVIAGRMWACRRQACESASRCRSTLNNELIFFTGSSSFERTPQPFQFTRNKTLLFFCLALPRLLMVDEPFLGLAPRVVEQMKSVFQALQAEGIAILFIEQNIRLALSMAGRGYILESGRLAIEGDAPILINSPEVRRIFLGG
jgi:ABC-type branched-subunit amino acid transport system ATPase component